MEVVQMWPGVSQHGSSLGIVTKEEQQRRLDNLFAASDWLSRGSELLHIPSGKLGRGMS